ncbi:MAG: Flagellar protein FliS [Pseudomonadota bacterium]|jgi:flagellar secretion chaperone FliS
MRSFARAAESYGAVQVMSGVASADNVQLIQMLFDGFLESLSVAKGHILNNAIEEKSKSISRASRIVVGLQGALDFQRGGELAQNLNDLYNYVLRRLIHVNVRNDLQALEEIHGLMQDVADAWQNLPALLGTAGRQTSFAS